MTANYHLPLVPFSPLDTVQLNRRFAQLDGALHGLGEGLFNYTDLTADPALPATGHYRLAVKNGTVVIYDTSGEIIYGIPADYAHLRDKKTSGTHGGTATTGAWETRALNEIVVDTGGHCALASNQITAAAGTYIVYALCPAWRVNTHQARLYDITNGATLLTGTAAYSASAAATYPVTFSVISGRITLTAATVLEVQHTVQTTNAGDGYGLAGSIGDEIYTTIVLRRQQHVG